MKKIAIIGAGISGLFFANLIEKDKTYSPLSLYFLLDNGIITEKNEINELFDIIINEIGELLNSSNLENTISILNNTTNMSSTTEKSTSNKTKVIKKNVVKSKKLNIKKISKVKSSSIIDNMFNFSFNNFDENQIKINLMFDIKENFVIRKKNDNESIYEIDLEKDTLFSKELKSEKFKSLNV